MMVKRMPVRTDGKRSYDIVISDSFERLPEELGKLGVKSRKVCIVTETGVAPFYLEQVEEILDGQCRELQHFIFEQGEENKNLDTVRELYRFLIENHFDRKDLLLALGGGVVGDLTGFAAATYLRGIDFVQVPTSLLAQVDSSIGGKTGVDFEAYKNMVGAFYMPKLVYMNINTLRTLSIRQYHSGLGEVIKHGLIRDKSYYRWVKDHRRMIEGRAPETMAVMVERSCRIKREVVEEDPREKGIRACLNFGHTFGHSIEKKMNLSLTHGECVAIGSLLAARMSLARGYLKAKEMEDIEQLYASFNYPEYPAELSAEEVIEETRHDKKMEKGRIKFVLLKEVGKAGIYTDVTDEEMRQVLEAQK